MESKESSRTACWWMADDEKQRYRGTAQERYPSDLMQVVCGDAPLPDAFLTLLRYHDIQAHLAKDLLEREVRAVTMIVAESGAIWRHLPRPTLQFPPKRSRPEKSYIELGHFSHLAALSAPSDGERALAAAGSPCWARVSRHLERELGGFTGPLACRYEPISTEEAVATLGLERILIEIEAATQDAGVASLAEAQSQEERRAQLLPVERMLGWRAEAAPAHPRSVFMRLLLTLTAHDRGAWMAVSTFLAILMIGIFILY